MARVSEGVASHEAGHAIASILCGHSIYRIQAARGKAGAIIVDRRERVLLLHGLTETTQSTEMPETVEAILRSHPELSDRLWASAVNFAFLCGAGPAAEARANHRSLVGVWLSWSARGDHQAAHMAFKPFVPDERSRDQLIFRVWDKTAPLITRRNWRAVEAVSALLKSGEENGEIIQAIASRYLDNVPPRPLQNPILPIGAPF